MTGLSIWMLLLGLAGIVVSLYGFLGLIFPGLMIRSSSEESTSIGFMPPESSNGALRLAALLLFAVGLGLDGVVWLEYQGAQKGIGRAAAAAAIAQDLSGGAFVVSTRGQQILVALPGETSGHYFEIDELDAEMGTELPAEAIALFVVEASADQFGWDPPPDAVARMSQMAIQLAMNNPDLKDDVISLSPEEQAALNAARAAQATPVLGVPSPAPVATPVVASTPTPAGEPAPARFAANNDAALADQLVGDASHAWKIGDKAMALQLAKRAHELRSAALGADHEKTQEVARMIAMAENALNPPAPSPDATPAADPAEADRLIAQANDAWHQGRRDDAINAARQAVAIRRAALGEEHPKTQEALKMLKAAEAAATPVAR